MKKTDTGYPASTRRARRGEAGKILNTKYSSGFTVVEILLALAVFVVIGIIGSANYASFRNRRLLEEQVDIVVADIRETMSRSRTQESSNQWGVHFDNPTGNNNDFYQIWYGASYGAGTIVERVNLSPGLNFTDPAAGASEDAVFSKTTGLPTASSTIVIQSSASSASGTIDISTQGQVSYSIN